MTEIYRDSSVSLALGLTGATSVSAEVFRDGVSVYSTTGDTFALPFSITGFDGPFTATWTFTYAGTTTTRSESHVIVTPFATVTDVRTNVLNLPTDITDAQIIRTERRIRKLIERLTGQPFGQRQGTITVTGNDDTVIRLPERLVTLSAIAGDYVYPTLDYYAIRGDGWYLGRAANAPDGDWVFTNVIREPYAAWCAPFRQDYPYTITGVWGWDDVPEDIREAALILIERELCPDSQYRDRYFQAVTYADTTLEFNPLAFTGTGSLVADQLISGYMRPNMLVI